MNEFRQYELMQRNARIESISQTKADLAKTEEQLFFFDNFDRYEMEKEEKKISWLRTMPRRDWRLVSIIRFSFGPSVTVDNIKHDLNVLMAIYTIWV